MAREVVGQFRNRIEQVGTVATQTGLISAGDHARFLAVDAHEIFRTGAQVATNEIVASCVVLARIHFAFVYVRVAPKRNE